MIELLCPFGAGRHKLKPWQEVQTGRSGFACVHCSKTWEHVSWWPHVVATYDLPAKHEKIGK